MRQSPKASTALRKALLQLGYQNTYHGYEACLENPRDSKYWLEGLRAKFDNVGKSFSRHEFDQLLGHCQAVTDVPCAIFARELIAAYPDAQVILSHRDIDSWYSSISTGVLPDTYTFSAKIAAFLATLFLSPSRWARPMMCRIWEDFYEGSFEANGKRKFEEHNAMVRGLVPRERLLEYRVQDGWVPLCQFLGKPVPKRPFPKGNDREETKKKVKAAVRSEMNRALRNSSWIILLCGMIFTFITGFSKLSFKLG